MKIIYVYGHFIHAFSQTCSRWLRWCFILLWDFYIFLFFGLRSLNTPQLSLNFIALVWLFITCELIFNIGAVDSFWIEFKMGFGYELRCNNWLMGQSHAHVLYKTTETTTTTPTTTTTTATTVYDILIMLLSNCCCRVESQL